MRLGVRAYVAMISAMIVFAGCGGLALDDGADTETLELAEVGQALTDPCLVATPTLALKSDGPDCTFARITSTQMATTSGKRGDPRG